MWRSWTLPLAMVLVAALVGCGGEARALVGPAKVRGLLVRHGKPMKVAEGDAIEIELLPADGAAADLFSASADFNPADGTFAITGQNDGGIRPGEYRVALRWDHLKTGEDRFGEAFFSDETPLRLTVTDQPEQQIVIDVGKRTVTKKS